MSSNQSDPPKSHCTPPPTSPVNETSLIPTKHRADEASNGGHWRIRIKKSYAVAANAIKTASNAMSDAVFATENAVQPVDMQPVDMLPAEAHGGIDVPLSKQQNDDFHAHMLSRGYAYNGEGYVHDVRAFDIFATENSAPQTSEHMARWTEQTRLPSPQPVGMHTILPTIQNIMHSNSSDAIPIVTTGEETMSGGTAFHECMSPPIRAENSPREEPRETPPASPARNSNIRSDATSLTIKIQFLYLVEFLSIFLLLPWEWSPALRQKKQE